MIRPSLLLAAAVVALPGWAFAAGADLATPPPEGAPLGDEVQRFCTGIADEARDRRYQIQEAELTALRADIDVRMAALEAKRAEYEQWLSRREAFLEKAEDGVVEIYSKMRPDAAAERLAELDAELAAGILIKLDRRKAGIILNEMERKAAAMLTAVMASVARREDPS